MSYRVKLLVSVAVLMAIAVALGGTMLISASFDAALSREKETALKAFQMILYTLEAVSRGGVTDFDAAMRETLDSLDERAGRSWTALRLESGDTVVYAGGSRALRRGDMLAAEAENYRIALFAEEDGRHYLQISGAFLVGERETYRLAALFDITGVYRDRESQIHIYQQVYIPVMAVSSGAALVMSTFLTRPLRRLSKAARTVAEGDLTCRADIGTKDEIGGLARDFNLMTDKLAGNIDELQEAMRRQEAFMGSFAHELKTPMTSIIGYSDMLRSQQLSPEDQQQAANYIFSESKRLESLSLKLLDLLVLKKRDFDFSPCRPAQLLRETARGMAPRLKEQGIRLTLNLQEGVCSLEPDLVKSLMYNLLDNARKAMDGGGRIVARVRVYPGGCRLQVADDGRGMAPEELERITRAFYRVDKSRSRAQGGAGLGLALCSEIVAIHGGRMHFQSEPGKGTCVTVDLRGQKRDLMPK